MVEAPKGLISRMFISIINSVIKNDITDTEAVDCSTEYINKPFQWLINLAT